MANLTRQQTRYMSRDEFNALDKSTVPAGTEIDIVDKIQKEDLSTELLNAIESGSTPGVGIDYGSNSAEGALFIGHYNNPEENAIFQIGTGSSASDRNNLLTVYEDLEHSQPKMTFNGNASITGDTIIGTLFVTSAPVNENGVIRKQDLDEALSQISKPSWHSEAPEDTSKVLLTKITLSTTEATDVSFPGAIVIVDGYKVNYIYGTYQINYNPPESSSLSGHVYGYFTGHVFIQGAESLVGQTTFNTAGIVSCVSVAGGQTYFRTEDPGTYTNATIEFKFLY